MGYGTESIQVSSPVHIKVSQANQTFLHYVQNYIVEIYSRDHARYLGVDISSDLNFNHHINCVTANASKSLGFLKKKTLKQDIRVYESRGQKYFNITLVLQANNFHSSYKHMYLSFKSVYNKELKGVIWLIKCLISLLISLLKWYYPVKIITASVILIYWQKDFSVNTQKMLVSPSDFRVEFCPLARQPIKLQ